MEQKRIYKTTRELAGILEDYPIDMVSLSKLYENELISTLSLLEDRFNQYYAYYLKDLYSLDEVRMRYHSDCFTLRFAMVSLSGFLFRLLGDLDLYNSMLKDIDSLFTGQEEYHQRKLSRIETAGAD